MRSSPVKQWLGAALLGACVVLGAHFGDRIGPRAATTHPPALLLGVSQLGPLRFKHRVRESSWLCIPQWMGAHLCQEGQSGRFQCMLLILHPSLLSELLL